MNLEYLGVSLAADSEMVYYHWGMLARWCGLFYRSQRYARYQSVYRHRILSQIVWSLESEHYYLN